MVFVTIDIHHAYFSYAWGAFPTHRAIVTFTIAPWVVETGHSPCSSTLPASLHPRIHPRSVYPSWTSSTGNSPLGSSPSGALLGVHMGSSSRFRVTNTITRSSSVNACSTSKGYQSLGIGTSSDATTPASSSVDASTAGSSPFVPMARMKTTSSSSSSELWASSYSKYSTGDSSPRSLSYWDPLGSSWLCSEALRSAVSSLTTVSLPGPSCRPCRPFHANGTLRLHRSLGPRILTA